VWAVPEWEFKTSQQPWEALAGLWEASEGVWEVWEAQITSA